MKTVDEIIESWKERDLTTFSSDRAHGEDVLWLREQLNSLLEELAVRMEDLKVYSEREPGYDKDYNTALDNAVLNIRAAKSLPTNKESV